MTWAPSLLSSAPTITINSMSQAVIFLTGHVHVSTPCLSYCLLLLLCYLLTHIGEAWISLFWCRRLFLTESFQSNSTAIETEFSVHEYMHTQSSSAIQSRQTSVCTCAVCLIVFQTDACTQVLQHTTHWASRLSMVCTNLTHTHCSNSLSQSSFEDLLDPCKHTGFYKHNMFWV